MLSYGNSSPIPRPHSSLYRCLFASSSNTDLTCAIPAPSTGYFTAAIVIIAASPPPPPPPRDHVGSASVLRSRGSAARSRSVPRTKHRSRCNSPGSVAQSSRVAQRSGVGDRGGGAPGIARTAANRPPPPPHTPMQAHFFSLHYLRQLLFMRLRQHVRTMEQRDGRWERKRGWAESAGPPSSEASACSFLSAQLNSDEFNIAVT
jgi:hypothetical protein